MKGLCRIVALPLVLLIGVPGVQAEQVVFSEIMYHPAGTLPEYIEVYNNTATPMDIAEWRVSDGVDHTFPSFSADAPEQTFLKPFERIVLSSVEEAALRAAYNVPPTARVFGPWEGNLKNGGERITLRDKNGTLVCTVEYNDRGRWSPAADGTGHSLVLRNPDGKIDDWRNWTLSARPGGTPGSEQVQAAETPVDNPEVNLIAGIPFVNYGDIWRYNDENEDLGTAWRAPAFDDSAWPQGPGMFGFENSSLPAPGIHTPFTSSQQLTYYVRTSFTYNGSLKGVTMTIDQVLDDGAVYYLNGQEIGRSGMPSGTVTFATAAGRTVSDAVEELSVITASGSALVNGTNVLAVEIHQTNNTSSDVVFGMRLNISVPTQPSLQINEVLPDVAGVGFVEIHNPGAVAVHLRDHYLTDDPAELRKFRITTDVMIPAGGLGSVGFTESGLALTSPVRVYLVAPDGVTVINAINAVLPMDGRSLGRKPTGGTSWFLFTEPTRGTVNASQSNIAAEVHLNEIHFNASRKVDWVEIYNNGDEVVPLDGLFLASRADLSDRVPLSGSIPVGGYATQDVAFPVSAGEVSLFVASSTNSVLSARVFEWPAVGDCLQAFPQGSDDWYASTQSTRGAANNPARNTDIVINEIMYDPPSNEPSGEFIELYNRGTTAVDVSGWQFVDGISFTIPAGTTIQRDGCLVVAADANWVRAIYGNIPVVGDWDGQLSNRGEAIRLVDRWGNTADEVDYLTGGNWPNFANGGGGSMELQNPSMDNSLASAWFDSDESNTMPFEHYSYSDVFRQLTTMGSTTDYKELHFYLVGDSHVILKNIQVRLNRTGPNLILNGDRMSTDGRSANGWLAQGTHYASYISNGEFHIISDGHGDNRPNRVEIDVTAMQANQTYEVSFDARWVSGASRLVLETWDHSIATSISLPVAAGTGTPGLRNSRFVATAAPQVDGLMHDPAVPAAHQTVRLTAHVTSQTPSPQVLLFHRLDNNAGSGTWASKPMYDDGTSGGDEHAGDGIYTAELTEYGQNGQVIQFYVQASAPTGQSTRQPKEGADRPAMYVIDTSMNAGDLRRMRFVVSALDLRAISAQDSATPPYGYAFPRLSNHYFNATIIINEKDVIYGGEIRPAGSPWTRGGSMDRAKFKYPKDNVFRDRGNMLYRNYDVGWWSHDRIVRYWLYLLGNPTLENEYIVVKVNNSGSGSVREEVETVHNEMLDRAYEDGSEGELYKIDDEWWFTDNWDRRNRNADWSYKSSDNPGRYRSEWMKRTKENEDDHSALVSFFKKVYSNSYSQTDIERLVDPVALLKACAVAGYIHAWDFFSLDRGKNCYMYRRSTDGRFMFFPWDLKRSFDNSGAAFYNGMAGFRPWLEKSYNMRLFKHYLTRLIENYTTDSVRIACWLQLQEDASTQFPFNFNYANWFVSRQSSGNNFLGSSRSMPFSVSGSGRQAVTTSADTASLTGVAPLRVFRVEVADHPEARFTWASEYAWILSGIFIHSGTNVLTARGVDEFGTVLHEETVTVRKTGDAPPVMAIKAEPSWQLPLIEPLTADASDSFDPEGAPLQYSWSITPSDASLDTRDEKVAVAAFSHPGVYTIEVAGQDANGLSTAIQRDAIVYGSEGLSEFDEPRLELFWNMDNVAIRTNYVTGPSYSLTEVSGSLVLQVWDNQAFPLTTTSPKYPLIWRPVPPSTDWAFVTSLALRGLVFGDYVTGVLVETNEAGSRVRYVFGVEDGTMVTVRRVAASGIASLLRTAPWSVSQAELRVRRIGDTLAFEQQVSDAWTSRHSAALPAGATAIRVGMVLATDTAQSIKIAFDYSTFVDPDSEP
ncbi:MAG: lamin tail domain-containing protein [Sedimentisphaerales bacterium]|nr:lamin tail domain-containing protein [Sedimentisphaerales bacterium]